MSSMERGGRMGAALARYAVARSALEASRREEAAALISAWTAGATVRQLANVADTSKSAMGRRLARAAEAWRGELLPGDVDQWGDVG